MQLLLDASAPGPALVHPGTVRARGSTDAQQKAYNPVLPLDRADKTPIDVTSCQPTSAFLAMTILELLRQLVVFALDLYVSCADLHVPNMCAIRPVCHDDSSRGTICQGRSA